MPIETKLTWEALEEFLEEKEDLALFLKKALILLNEDSKRFRFLLDFYEFQ
jgi:hypothetical protein